MEKGSRELPGHSIWFDVAFDMHDQLSCMSL